MKVPITHRVYWVTGFVVSGWHFYMPGKWHPPDERMRKWEGYKISDRWVKLVYTWLELVRRLRGRK